MFDDLEKKARNELIRLYEAYIKNPDDSSLEEQALSCEQSYSSVPILSKEVSHAGFKCLSIALKELSVIEAKQILNSLKNQEK